MKRIDTTSAALSVIFLLGCFVETAFSETEADTSAATSQTVLDAVKNGRAYINFRYRYEFADQDGLPENADASTLRSRLGFETDSLHGLHAVFEIEDVQEIGPDDYNNTINGKSDHPVVADPEGTEVNQAYLAYSGLPNTKLKAGRHALTLDNARFIGDVAWRQNNQTQDGVTLSNTSIEDTTLFYGYTFGVNRIFGEDSPIGEFDTNLHMFNINNASLGFAKITLYAYLLDIEESPTDSSITFGGRAHGKTELTDGIFAVYDAEYAYQQDYEDNPTSYNANYYRVDLGAHVSGVTLKAGFESLGSDDGAIGFSTPLSTLHKFNGWADKFLVTPADGLQDAYGSIIFKAKDIHEHIDGLKFVATYHDFSSDEGSSDYGTEWNLLLDKSFGKDYGVGVKYANYNAEDFSTDIERLIFELRAGFSQ